MASTKYLLFAVLIITPFAENAPSGKQNTSEDELRTRLVFADSDNAINSNSPPTASRAAPILPVLKDETPITTVTRSKHVLEPVPVNSEGNTKMDDERQNWGLVVEESDELPDDESYYIRPLSLPRNINTRVLVPEKPTKVQPVVKPAVVNAAPKPSTCDVAIISCCGVQSHLIECFKSRNCFSVTESMLPNVCSKTSINNTIETLSRYYKGVMSK